MVYSQQKKVNCSDRAMPQLSSQFCKYLIPHDEEVIAFPVERIRFLFWSYRPSSDRRSAVLLSFSRRCASGNRSPSEQNSYVVRGRDAGSGARATETREGGGRIPLFTGAAVSKGSLYIPRAREKSGTLQQQPSAKLRSRGRCGRERQHATRRGSVGAERSDDRVRDGECRDRRETSGDAAETQGHALLRQPGEGILYVIKKRSSTL